MSDRFYTDAPLAPGEVTLDGPEARHMLLVRRFAIGDAVELFNGDGNSYSAIIREAAGKHAILDIVQANSPANELPFRLVVASALPKGDRLDYLIEKLTELGVTDFMPLICERSVVIPKSEKTDKYRRAVIEASKQCGRCRLMAVHPPRSFAMLLADSSLPGARLIAHPSGDALRTFAHHGDVAMAIGPEGGFTDNEAATASQSGWTTVNLGPRILRVETAATSMAAWLGLR